MVSNIVPLGFYTNVHFLLTLWLTNYQKNIVVSSLLLYIIVTSIVVIKGS